MEIGKLVGVPPSCLEKQPGVSEKLIFTLGLETWVRQALSDSYLYPINVIVACTPK